MNATESIPSFVTFRPSLSKVNIFQNDNAKIVDYENEDRRYVQCGDPIPPSDSTTRDEITSRSYDEEWQKFFKASKTTTLRLQYIKGIEDNEKLQHTRIAKRFKELRKFGMATSIAMEKARDENYGNFKKEDVGKRVGAMFGA